MERGTGFGVLLYFSFIKQSHLFLLLFSYFFFFKAEPFGSLLRNIKMILGH